MSILRSLRSFFDRYFVRFKGLIADGELIDTEDYGCRTVYCGGYAVTLHCIKHSYRAFENLMFGIKPSIFVYQLYSQTELQCSENVKQVFNLSCMFHLSHDPKIPKNFSAEAMFEQYYDSLQARAKNAGLRIKWDKSLLTA